MSTIKGCTAGWLLVVLAIALLLFRGQSGLLFILLPISLILACGIMGSMRHGRQSRQGD